MPYLCKVDVGEYELILPDNVLFLYCRVMKFGSHALLSRGW